jgi:hypothetical protein
MVSDTDFVRKHVEAWMRGSNWMLQSDVSKMARVGKVVVKVRICNIYLHYVRQRKCFWTIIGLNLKQKYRNDVAKFGRKFTAVRLCCSGTLFWKREIMPKQNFHNPKSVRLVCKEVDSLAFYLTGYCTTVWNLCEIQYAVYHSYNSL